MSCLQNKEKMEGEYGFVSQKNEKNTVGSDKKWKGKTDCKLGVKVRGKVSKATSDI